MLCDRLMRNHVKLLSALSAVSLGRQELITKFNTNVLCCTLSRYSASAELHCMHGPVPSVVLGKERPHVGCELCRHL